MYNKMIGNFVNGTQMRDFTAELQVKLNYL